MRSYPSVVAGRPVEVDQWIYSIRASAGLTDPEGAADLRLRLRRGEPEPLTDDRVVGRVGTLTPEDHEHALEKANSAQREWALWSWEDRVRVAVAINERLAARREELEDVCVSEGYPRAVARWGIDSAVAVGGPEMFDAVAPAMRLAVAGRAQDTGLRQAYVVRRPDGVVCVSPPQNASVFNAVLAIPTMAAGNAVIVRAPATRAYGVAWWWHEVVQPVMDQFSVPAGVGSLVCARAEVIVHDWLSSPWVDDIFFFGGSKRGIALGRECEAAGKKPVLELAGNDTLVVWRDADLMAAALAAAENLLASGQICMVPKRIVVHPEVADEFIEILAGIYRRALPAMPEDEDTVLAALAPNPLFDLMVRQGLAAGARLICGGARVAAIGEPEGAASFYEPTIMRIDGWATARQLDVVNEETFFPLLPVVVPDPGPDEDVLEKVLEFVEGNEYGLRNSLWTDDDHIVDRFLAGVNVGGSIKVNESHVEFVPGLASHGGTGLTGGVHGEANYPVLRTTRAQAISLGNLRGPERFRQTSLPALRHLLSEGDRPSPDQRSNAKMVTPGTSRPPSSVQ
jgi:acyl-CoA reductase-like NAD-dependent aldehyde dehydrogenase